MTDYQRLIDAETWAFIARTGEFYPPDAVGLSIAGQRAVYDRMCAAFRVARPDGVAVTEGAIQAGAHPVPIRRYAVGAGAVEVVYFHGGGFVVGGLESHDDICAELCAATGFAVTAVDYRLAPEHLHPAAFEDALAAFRAVAATGARVLLAGDSAGGNLAAAVAHATRRDPVRPIGQVLIYPGLGGDPDCASARTHAEAPMLTRADVDFYRSLRTGGREVTGDATLAPLQDTDFTGLPPTVAIGADCDPLCDDAPAYAARIRAAGGLAEARVDAGLVHAWLRARHSVPRARDAFARIVADLRRLGAAG